MTTGTLIALLATIFVGAVSVRTLVRFDLNRWIDQRKVRKKDALYRLCPHVVLEPHDGRIAFRNQFVSPPGTNAWWCQECGYITYDDAFMDNNIEYWAKHPEQYSARRKKMGKLIKRL